MDKAEEALLIAAATALPGLGKWLADLIDGKRPNPAQTQRVRDVLPERSASEAAADALRDRLDDEEENDR